jgi:hypothetical protein
MRYLRQVAVAGLLLSSGPAHAQTDGQLWANFLAQGRISGDLIFWVDTSARFSNDATQLGQTLARGGIGARVSKNLSLHAGYAHVRTTPARGTRTVEHRGWQQALYPIIRGDRAQLVGRTRLEQRWLEGQGGMSLRARQLFRLSAPLGEASAPRFLAWHESFLTLTDTSWSPDTGFDQHRSFVGLALPIGPHALEVGAFAQRFPQPEPDRVNRALNVTLVANF